LKQRPNAIYHALLEVQLSALLAKHVMEILPVVAATLFFVAYLGMMHRVDVVYRARLALMKIVPRVLNALATRLAQIPILSIAELISTMHQQPVSGHAQVDYHLSVLLAWIVSQILLAMLTLHIQHLLFRQSRPTRKLPLFLPRPFLRLH